MPLFHLTPDRLSSIPATDFSTEGVLERADLQRLLQERLEVILPDAMVLSDEFGDWDESKRRIDLLAMDREANLVVIELKRTTDDKQLDLQAIRYAAMADTMTFDQAVAAHARYLARLESAAAQNNEVSESSDQASVLRSTKILSASGGNSGGGGGGTSGAEAAILAFLDWPEPQEELFGQSVRIVLVAADFTKEVTTSVLWLNKQELDISCVRLRPHRHGEELILDVQRIIPLPEAEDYLIRARDKSQRVRQAIREDVWGSGDGYWFINVGESAHNSRCWEDCRRYGFMLAGGGPKWIRQIQRLQPGDRIFAYLSGHGYVGVGEVTSEAMMQRDFVPPGSSKRLVELPLEREPDAEELDDPERCDWCIAVDWSATVDRTDAHKLQFRRQTVCRMHDGELTQRLLDAFGV